MAKSLKILLIIAVIFLIVISAFYLFLHIAFDGIFTGPSYTKDDLIENYEQRQEQIAEAKNYFESILPENAMSILNLIMIRNWGFFTSRQTVFLKATGGWK